MGEAKTNGPWRAERLLTREGDYVITAEVPRFNPPAEVIVWGSRIFVRTAAGEYREGIVTIPHNTFNE